LLLAATGPIVLIGLGLLLYNARRFGNPFEFGQHYQLNAERRLAQQSFNLRYFWFNFRIYFLEPARWSAHFPFVHDIIVPPLPPHYDGVEGAFGVLTNMPLVWLALAVPLAWRSQSRPAASMILRWFVTTVALLFGIGALTLGLFCGANFRYEVDFLPALVLLAVVGILGLERALTDRPAWRRAVRWGWGLLLGFSVAFNLLASVEYYATAHNLLGLVAGTSGRVEEAIAQYEQVLRLDPDYVEAHNNLGVLLARSGRMQAAAEHWEQALRITPNNASLHYNLANALARMGRTREAMEHWEQALRIQPDFATAHCNLGVVLAQAGETQKAMEHFEQALRIKPDLAEAHYNLGLALARLGRVPEAIGNYEQALRIKPDYADAQNALTRLQAGQ
jgi:tetratricopeptide (TPR) repeat protein